MNAQDEDQETIQSAAYNPFPEPQTIPAGWDTSTFFSYSPSASIEPVDDMSEKESE